MARRSEEKAPDLRARLLFQSAVVTLRDV